MGRAWNPSFKTRFVHIRSDLFLLFEVGLVFLCFDFRDVFDFR